LTWVLACKRNKEQSVSSYLGDGSRAMGSIFVKEAGQIEDP